MPWYRTGTVAITAGQTTVTGTGTTFSANARVGDALLGPDGNWYEVTNIASATVLSILPAYKGVTVAAGTYAIAPVQGYTKTLADKFNDIANTWGSTLAGLGSVSTENVVPVNKGGTGGNTAALGRTGLGLGAAAVAAILGTVSQSGGVPNGAIMETGSNANGTYFKFANGCLVCYAKDLSLTFSNVSNLQTNWTYPSIFSQPPLVLPKLDLTNYAVKIYNTTKEVYQRNVGTSSASIGIAAYNAWASGDQSLVTIGALAIGRWF
ncbi:phage tail protein [Pseudomonas asiatica]|uniref:phage tail protein n=1 Tax=Pseudomonas asiatica TaxID=2219225 RepID=UPI0015F81BCC|nr:phage tail protein [Pseudomonas asiatica]MBA6111493.1 phage tail protein [Pseudomonas asiatica]